MNSENYIPMDLVFDAEGRDKLLKGVKTIAKAVKSTLGPQGNTVLLEDPNYPTGMRITKDGYTVAKSIDVADPVEELAVRIMKQASAGTVKGAGDGTTTSIVLAEALVEQGIERLNDKSLNRSEVIRHLTAESKEIIERLNNMAIPVDDKMIQKVARISANNDVKLGDLIAEAYTNVELNGVVTAERAMDEKTYIKTVKGARIDRGYDSRGFINDQSSDECVLENPFVLLSGTDIGNMLQIKEVLKFAAESRHPLLIIAPCGEGLVRSLVANKVKNELKWCSVQQPSFGWKQKELMEDLAVTAGGKFFSEEVGTDLSLLTPADLGRVKKAVISGDETILTFYTEDSPRPDMMWDEAKIQAWCEENDILPENFTPDMIPNYDADQAAKLHDRVEELKGALKRAKKKSEKEFIEERIAMLQGGISVVFVGGQTEIERGERYDRVDDAICAVRSSIEEGILAGAGVPLARISQTYFRREEVEMGEVDPNLKAARDILYAALFAPIKQLFDNADKDVEYEYKKHDDILTGGLNNGVNLLTGEYGDLIEMGVIDPKKVTRKALESAISVAATILTTNAIGTLKRVQT